MSKAQILLFNTKKQLRTEIEEIELEIKKTSKMIMSTDLVNMKRVMRRLDFVDKNDVPHLKGKVAAGLSAADEVLVTELIFNNFFSDLDAHQIAAVMSCLVYTDGKSEGKPPKDDSLAIPFQKLLETANKVVTVMIESNIDIKKEDYLQKFVPDMMEITQKWCQGAKFSEVCDISEGIFEGTIIRALRRLDELIS